LKELSLENSKLTDECLFDLTPVCQTLTSINLQSNQLSPEAILKFIMECKNLEVVKIPVLSDDCLKRLLDERPQLSIVMNGKRVLSDDHIFKTISVPSGLVHFFDNPIHLLQTQLSPVLQSSFEYIVNCEDGEEALNFALKALKIMRQDEIPNIFQFIAKLEQNPKKLIRFCLVLSRAHSEFLKEHMPLSIKTQINDKLCQAAHQKGALSLLEGQELIQTFTGTPLSVRIKGKKTEGQTQSERYLETYDFDPLILLCASSDKLRLWYDRTKLRKKMTLPWHPEILNYIHQFLMKNEVDSLELNMDTYFEIQKKFDEYQLSFEDFLKASKGVTIILKNETREEVFQLMSQPLVQKNVRIIKSTKYLIEESRSAQIKKYSLTN
jgi:hypothetical protein